MSVDRLPCVDVTDLSDESVRKAVRDSPAPIIRVPSEATGVQRRMAERWAIQLGAIVRIDDLD